MAEMIRIAIVDDHPLFREGLVHTLEAAPAMQVVAEAGTAEEARRVSAEWQPDILLLDLYIPGNGIEAAKVIRTEHPGVKIVVLTASEEDDDVTSAIEAGAKGYLVKGVSGSELIRAVQSVHAGASYITPQLAARMLMQPRVVPAAVKREEAFTFDELKILEHLSRGLTNNEIADNIGLNLRATKRCMTQIFRKLHVRNRVEALLAAQKLAPRAPA